MTRTKNIGVYKLEEELIKLNEGYGRRYYLFVWYDEYDKVCIVTNLDMKKAVFPEGYYYDHKLGITNRSKSTVFTYEAFRVYSLRYFNLRLHSK